MKTAGPKPWNAFFENNEGYWCLFLLSFATAAHAYSIVVTGAKFWIDSIVYFQLALALFDADQLGRLYNSEFGFLYSHTTPGLPLLIWVLNSIFHARLWPALAVIQGLLSALAVTYFVLAFRNSEAWLLGLLADLEGSDELHSRAKQMERAQSRGTAYAVVCSF